MAQKNAFGTRLRTMRKEKALTQGELGALLFNTSKQTIHNWEAGTREPGIEKLWILADYFNVSIDYLVGRKER